MLKYQVCLAVQQLVVETVLKEIKIFRSIEYRPVILYEIDTKYKVNIKLTFDGKFFPCDFHFDGSCFRKELMIIILAVLYLFKFVSTFLKI